MVSILAAHTAQASDTCQLEFDFQAGKDIGTITKDAMLTGAISFAVDREWQQGAETRSYFVNGTIDLSHETAGTVTGDAHIVHVVRAPHTWDYISIVARNVRGNLGGETRYFDPMVFTLADAPNTLTGFELPVSADAWNQLMRTQKFQVHTPDGNQIFFGKVSGLSGTCTR